MSILIPKQAINQLRKSLENFRLNKAIELCSNEAQTTAHFLKTILASRINGTFGVALHTSRLFAKPKEPFFANAPI